MERIDKDSSWGNEQLFSRKKEDKLPNTLGACMEETKHIRDYPEKVLKEHGYKKD